MNDTLLIILLIIFAFIALFIYKLYRAVKYSSRLLNRKSHGIVGEILLASVPVIKGLLSQKNSNISSQVPIYQYKRKPYCMNSSEFQFFTMLQSAIGDQFYIFPQIHLTTLFDEKINGQNWRGARSHIDKKSVDFVLCDKQHVAPLLAIELDGNSHDMEDRIERDREVERIFKEAGFSLLRIDRQQQYDQADIVRQISEALQLNQS